MAVATQHAQRTLTLLPMVSLMWIDLTLCHPFLRREAKKFSSPTTLCNTMHEGSVVADGWAAARPEAASSV